MPPPVAPIVSATAPAPDPRVGLKAGRWDAAQAAWNMRMLSTTPPKGRVLGATHSDLAFTGKYVIQGNYNGFEIYDISNPAKPALMQTYLCPASQNDVSVYRNLLFMSAEATNSRADCGFEGVPEPVSKLRVRGIRVFDIADVKHPKLVTTVQTCRGSHTHTVVTDQSDDSNVYIYVSGTSSVRSAEEVPGCADGGIDDPNTARFRLEVIKVPLRAAERAAIVSSPRIFQGLPVPPRNDERAASDERDRQAAAAAAAAEGRGRQGGPGGGADAATRDRRPVRTSVTTLPCTRRSGWRPAPARASGCCWTSTIRHIPFASTRRPTPTCRSGTRRRSATTASKVLFTDEWGGGGQPRCRATDKKEWGANALFTIDNRKLTFHGYYKLPAPQTPQENCVAHNGSLIPIPGRDIMVQGWYQGGLSVFDWTDVDHPQEIAYFDRGPIDEKRMMMGGSWSAYWYNGVIVSSEIARGLDIYELRAERPHQRERARRREDGEDAVPEHAGSAEDRLGAELRAGARVSRSARAIEGSRVGDDCHGADDACHRRALGIAAQSGADTARLAAEHRRRLGARSGQGACPLHRGQRSGERAAVTRAATKARSHEGLDVLRVFVFSWRSTRCRLSGTAHS